MKEEDKAEKGQPAKILIIDDHPLIRKALEQLIDEDKELEVCGQADNPRAALQVIESLSPDMVIVDLSLKNGTSGIELIKEIKLRYPTILILVLSIFDESVYGVRSFRAGARGYIMKEETTEKVLGAIHQILKGGYYMSDNLSARFLNQIFDYQDIENTTLDNVLTDRELEVFRLYGEGYGTSQIARKLNVSMKTIQTYRGHIKRKLKLSNTYKLIQYATQWMMQQNQ